MHCSERRAIVEIDPAMSADNSAFAPTDRVRLVEHFEN